MQLVFSCRRSWGSKGEGVGCVGVHVTPATWVCNVLHGAGSANLYGIEVRSCTRRHGSSARLHGCYVACDRVPGRMVSEPGCRAARSDVTV